MFGSSRKPQLEERPAVTGRCEKHAFDPAVDICSKCGQARCGDCLVYPFGPKKPPFCINCALVAGGIRRN
ncbi:MAG TPA: hypothetical protein VGI06_01675 [Acidimicrobiales bacterium]|jgi:hypothetical protein